MSVSLRCAGAVISALLCAGVLPAGSGCASQRTAHAAASSNEKVIRAAFERWRARTGGPFELLDQDAAWTIVGSSPYSKTYQGREAFMSEVIRPFNARLTEPLRPTVREVTAAGDTIVVLFDAEAMATDGIAYRNTYSWHMVMRDGRIVRATAFFDTRLFDEFWQRVQPTG